MIVYVRTSTEVSPDNFKEEIIGRFHLEQVPEKGEAIKIGSRTYSVTIRHWEINPSNDSIICTLWVA